MRCFAGCFICCVQATTSSNGGDSYQAVAGFTKALQVDTVAGRVAVWGQRGSDTFNKLYYSSDNGTTWVEKTKLGYRFPFLRNIALDPVVPGKIWVSGMSAYVAN